MEVGIPLGILLLKKRFRLPWVPNQGRSAEHTMHQALSQLTFTSSESIIKALEKVQNIFKANNKKHQNDLIDVVLVFYY